MAPQNIHLTLKFLGAISPDAVAPIARVMREAGQNTPPFVLGVHGLGVFPNQKRVQIVWAGVTGDVTKLVELQKRLDGGLAGLGFAAESRAFTAHLTLARMREDASPAEREAAGNLVQATRFEGGDFAVDSISLIRSELRREGPLYTRIAAVPFSPLGPG